MPKTTKELTQRFEMKCGPEDYTEWMAAASMRQQGLSAFVRDAARAAARGGLLDMVHNHEADALRALVRMIEHFDRETRLRILESACTLMREDDSANTFREMRTG